MSCNEECMWLADAGAYAAIRGRCREGDPATEPCARQLRRCAEQLCRDAAPAVTDKAFTRHSPSRDARDYVSIGTYWWPDSEAQDGLPFVQRDGLLSPHFHLYDRPRWDRAAAGIVAAVKAAYFLDEPRFAREAVRRLRRWFCAPETAMHPHLRYAQMIPGCCTGGSAGLIDFSLYLPAVLDHLQLLVQLDDGAWTNMDRQIMAAWCAALLAWLEEHPFGREEEGRNNNHGVYYDRLVVCLALFLGQPERARGQLHRSRQRIARQIRPDGSMPAELHRTCSFGYTVMNLRGFVDLAAIAHRLDTPLRSPENGAGPETIRAAVDFLYRHACSETAWPYEQIEPIDWRMIWPVLAKAGTLFSQPYAYPDVAHRMPPGFVPHAFAMIEPVHPFGAPRSPEAMAAVPGA